MITWRRIYTDLSRMSDKELDMGASIVINSGTIKIVDLEDGFEYADLHPGLANGQPFLAIEVDY